MGSPRREAPPELFQFCITPRQKEVLEAINAHGGIRGAARHLGVSMQLTSGTLKAVEKRAVLQGWSPPHDMTRVAPLPYVVKGVSSFYNKDGQLAGQWVKTRLDDDMAEQAIRTFIEDLAKTHQIASPLVPAPAHNNADLLAVYPMGDPHFGMYAWAAEAGDDFDTAIAERITCGAIDRLVASAAPAETAIILPLGDLIHADTSSNRTPNSGAGLDVDTRWARVMQIGLRALIHAIVRALEKHQRVIVRVVGGNHDPHASIAIGLALDAYFHNNERVKVDLSPAAHWYYTFGKVLIGSTHGDTTREKDLLGVMAADRPQDWGATTHRYWYCGHIHHAVQKEYPGVMVEYFRTLAPKDAWHAAQGYRSGRDMCCIVHHKSVGEIERHRCDVALVHGAEVAYAG